MHTTFARKANANPVYPYNIPKHKHIAGHPPFLTSSQKVLSLYSNNAGLSKAS